MPTFTNFTRGTLVTATFLNQLERGLYWLHDDVLRMAMELALQGINPSYVSMFYDLFSDTADFDSASVTPDMSVDTSNGVLKLPTGFTANTDYYYQSLLHAIPATITKANMLLTREDIPNTNVYPSLSAVTSGGTAVFTEKLAPISTRNITTSIGSWSESYETTGNSGAYTVNFDTTNGRINLPGGAADPWAAAAQRTSDSVAEVVQAASDFQRTNNGVSSGFLSDGSMVVAYTSKEFHATFINVRVRVVNPDGTLKSWSGNTFINVTTSAAADQVTPIVLPTSDGNAGVVWTSGTSMFYSLVNLTTGVAGASFSLGVGNPSVDAKIEPTTNFVWVGAYDRAAGQIRLWRFAHTASAFPAATVSSAPTGTPSQVRIALDQNNNVHFGYQDDTNNVLRYNIWDKAGAAWTYTFGSGDKTFARTISIPNPGDFQLIPDINQTGTNKFCWIVYGKLNGSSKNAVYMRTVVNGTLSAEFTVKSDVTNVMTQVNGAYDVTSGLLHVIYADSVNGLRTNTITSAGVLGTESTIDASATTGANAICVNSGQTRFGLAFRDLGADNNTASELMTTFKSLGYTLLSKTWQSTTRVVATAATRFFVTASQLTPTNTTATWQISADNGATWNTVTLGTVGTFTTPGTQIILRVTLLATDSSATPQIDSVSWKAQLPLIEEEFEWTGLSGVDVKVKLRGRSTNTTDTPKVHSLGVVVS